MSAAIWLKYFFMNTFGCSDEKSSTMYISSQHPTQKKHNFRKQNPTQQKLGQLTFQNHQLSFLYIYSPFAFTLLGELRICKWRII